MSSDQPKHQKSTFLSRVLNSTINGRTVTERHRNNIQRSVSSENIICDGETVLREQQNILKKGPTNSENQH